MILNVQIKAGSKMNQVKLVDGIYYVSTKSPAHENMANISLIKLLSEFIGVSKNRLTIKRGLKSKKKVIVLEPV
ncbi:DUF167 domain-containing protein [Candidatus Dojkabacteria bacterium]|nr:DUF167 domain-containing protein [Candidatus Dojkabacteria bacterium]